MDKPNTPKQSKGMFWTEKHDALLCREVLVVNPFSAKKKIVHRGGKWSEVAEALSGVPDPVFKVDERAVRERYNLLAQRLRRKLRDEEKASGIETDMSEVEQLVEEIIEKEDAAEESHEREVNGKLKEKRTAEEMRKKAMERFSETQKRKSTDGGEGSKKRVRSGDTLEYLRKKTEEMASVEREKVEMERNKLELETKKHEDMMKMMMEQQQQQQRQQQEFQAMMMTMVARVIDKPQ